MISSSVIKIIADFTCNRSFNFPYMIVGNINIESGFNQCTIQLAIQVSFLIFYSLKLNVVQSDMDMTHIVKTQYS